MPTHRPKPIALIILDGFGHRQKTKDNAIAHANTPYLNHLFATYPHMLISGSGIDVGLPDKQMGNSEVGHMNIGAGRIIYQDLTRIDAAIQDGDFVKNTILREAFSLAKAKGKAVHVMGLLSSGGVHSHERHLHALINMAAELKIDHLYIHAFLDGRDTPPQSALSSLEQLTKLCQQSNCGQIVSLIGRYYAMDRDKRFDRVKVAYDLLVDGTASYHAENAIEGLETAYTRGETDEFVKATTIHPHETPPITIQDGDVVIFTNFRADRAREITSALTMREFSGFLRENCPKLSAFVSFTQYDETFNLPIAFPPQTIQQILPEYLSSLGLNQLRIAETEKYAHVTFFFNGGREAPYPGENRILIPSPKVATYDLQPEMSAPELTQAFVQEIKKEYYDFIVCNFANPDMVGHTGNFQAAVQAIETIDACLAQIIDTILEGGGEAIITADHGNAEQLFDEATGQPHTAHTNFLVPFLYVGRKAQFIENKGKLSDIAPTILYLMGLPIPREMTGHQLLALTHSPT
ncbi:MAG: phosphoglycerate mutase (2,3-diphosphoglycerate-independent) [Gammaproteobacteria bacterium RIFCSPHIGHO2_12_FULL_38_14]|nr:MAG: phosphoglycerate mutase (2,3-diphosphoglycerate-independent) [Gammaproteobacteria bacterium RIFCSPHIGHO2_12_FULL_38_14]